MLTRTVLLTALLALCVPGFTQPAPQGNKLAHNVYFTLKDKSGAAQSRLVNDCHKYLKAHPGVVFFAAGRLADDMQRDVNDRGFDVSLHIVFQSKADHDRYQVNEKHKKFIEENQANWERVRVFDSYVR